MCGSEWEPLREAPEEGDLGQPLQPGDKDQIPPQLEGVVGSRVQEGEGLEERGSLLDHPKSQISPVVMGHEVARCALEVFHEFKHSIHFAVVAMRNVQASVRSAPTQEVGDNEAGGFLEVCDLMSPAVVILGIAMQQENGLAFAQVQMVNPRAVQLADVSL